MVMIFWSMWIILQQKNVFNFNQCLAVLSWNVTTHSCSVSITDTSDVPDSKSLHVFIQPRWVEAIKQHESGLAENLWYIIVLKVCFDSFLYDRVRWNPSLSLCRCSVCVPVVVFQRFSGCSPAPLFVFSLQLWPFCTHYLMLMRSCVSHKHYFKCLPLNCQHLRCSHCHPSTV